MQKAVVGSILKIVKCLLLGSKCFFFSKK